MMRALQVRGNLKDLLLSYWEPIALVVLLTGATYLFNWFNQLSLRSFDLLLCSMGLWLVLLAPALVLPRRPRRVLLFGVALIAGLIMLSDQIYFRYYQDFITMTSVALAGQVYGVRDSILSLARPADLAYLLPALCVALFGWFRSAPQPRKSAWLVACLVAGLGLGVFSGRYAVLLNQWGDGGHWDGNYPFVRQAGLFTFHVFDAQRFVARKLEKSALDPETVERVKAFFGQNERRPNVLTGIGRGMNLMVVQLESFESFPVGLTIDGQPVTPNLNRLSKEAMFFPNIFYQTARGNTSDAEFMLNNSLLPLREASVNWSYTDNEFHSLPQTLKQQGYATLALHGYNKIYWNREFMYPRLGFDVFYSESSFQHDEIINLGLSDASFYRQSLDFLKRHPEPFYAQLVSLTSHHPFRIPEEQHELSLPESIPGELRDYLHSVRYADRALGGLLQALEEWGVLDRTVLVVYGDHEGASLKHFKEIRQLQGRPVQREEELAKASLQTVPLFVRVPASPLTGTFEQVGGQIDILPTLSNILGIADDGIYLGQDLLEVPRQPTPLTGRYPLGSFADNDVVFIASPDGGLENGVYYDRAAEVKLDTALAAQKYRRVMEMVRVSAQVIRHNLITELREHALATRDSIDRMPSDVGEGG